MGSRLRTTAPQSAIQPSVWSCHSLFNPLDDFSSHLNPHPHEDLACSSLSDLIFYPFLPAPFMLPASSHTAFCAGLWTQTNHSPGLCSCHCPCQNIAPLDTGRACSLISGVDIIWPIKGQIISILGFVGHIISVATIQLYCDKSNQRPYINEWVWMGSNKYFWTLKFELYIILTCHELLIFLQKF